MIACPFCFCSCCRWQLSSARRAVSNNPRPGSVRGFFYARSRQAVPDRPRSRPASRRASRPSGCTPGTLSPRLRPFSRAVGIPAPFRPYPQNMPHRSQCPYKALRAAFIFRIHPTGSTRFSASCARLACPVMPCVLCHLAGSASAPPRICPTAPKGPARRRATFRPHFRAGFYSVFARVREGIPISLYAPDSRWHSRLP